MSLRSVIPALLLSSLTLTGASAAHAGTYVWTTKDAIGNITAQSPIYSGGTYTFTGKARGNNPGGQLLPFAFSGSDGYYEDTISNGCVPDAQGKATTCSTTLTASPITAKFTWQPAYAGDLPPASVIVSQGGYAQGFTQYASGNCVINYVLNDGLGSSNSGSAPKICKDTQRSVQSPSGDGSVSLTCSSSAAFTGNSGTMGYNGGSASANGIVYLGYNASVSPVTISLGGSVRDSSGNYNILVGQFCKSSLVGVPSSCTVSNYNWTVSGPTFQTWQSQTPTPFNVDATYEVDGPGPLTNATAGWYWNEVGKNSSKSETVTCSATVTPPVGQGPAFTVTASQKVNVWSPNWTGFGIGGDTEVINGLPSVGGVDTNVYLQATGTFAALRLGGTYGMTWKATVAPPSQAPVSFGSGSLILTQIVLQLDRESTDFAGRSGGEPDNGETGLDTVYPYGWINPAPNYLSGDGPLMNITNDRYASQNIQFEDYLMYFPPGSSQCVTVGHFVWSTSGSASVTLSPNGSWSGYNIPAGTVTPSGTQSIFVRANDFPTWTQIISEDQ